MADLVIREDKVILLEESHKEVRFHGHHVSVTNNDQVEAFPSGHFYAHPVEITMDGTILKDNPHFRNWLTEPFVKSYLDQVGSAASFEIVAKTGSKSNQAIVLNCLDACYGHALYKLFNSARYEHFGGKLIVIVHPNFQHFVPDYVDEIWLVQTTFRNQDDHLNGFHDFVLPQLKRYNKIQLAEVDMSIDLGEVDLTAFTKVSPFDFSQFAKGEPYEIILLLREDRMWLTSKVDQWLYLVWRKTRLRSLKKYLLLKERSNYKKLIKRVNRSIRVNWKSIGIGKGLSYSFLQDQRMDYEFFTQQEDKWCEQYATSHLCIGVHGSNMLIPSYLSGAYISLVPAFKIANYSEDFLPRKEPLQRTLFTARNLSTSNSPGEIAAHVVGILQGYLHGNKKSLSD